MRVKLIVIGVFIAFCAHFAVSSAFGADAQNNIIGYWMPKNDQGSLIQIGEHYLMTGVMRIQKTELKKAGDNTIEIWHNGRTLGYRLTVREDGEVMAMLRAGDGNTPAVYERVPVKPEVIAALKDAEKKLNTSIQGQWISENGQSIIQITKDTFTDNGRIRSDVEFVAVGKNVLQVMASDGHTTGIFLTIDEGGNSFRYQDKLASLEEIQYTRVQ